MLGICVESKELLKTRCFYWVFLEEQDDKPGAGGGEVQRQLA